MAAEDTPAFDAELQRIGNEGTVDGRGVQLSAELLERILSAAPRDGDRITLMTAQFDGATFYGKAGFDRVVFQDWAGFNRATFRGGAGFGRATFQKGAEFDGVTFHLQAVFNGATFQGEALFSRASFRGLAGFDSTTFKDWVSFFDATFHSEARFLEAAFQGWAGFTMASFHDRSRFDSVTFHGVAGFDEATFGGWVGFTGATFNGGAAFRSASFEGGVALDRATFERADQIGPLVARYLILDGSTFRERVQIEACAAALCARRAQFPAGVQFRLRWASVVLDDANMAAPAILAGVPPFVGLDERDATRRWQRLPPGLRMGRWRPRLMSVCRADVAGLRVANVDLILQP